MKVFFYRSLDAVLSRSCFVVSEVATRICSHSQVCAMNETKRLTLLLDVLAQLRELLRVVLLLGDPHFLHILQHESIRNNERVF